MRAAMRTMIARIKRFRAARRGSLAVEFALTLPMFLILVMSGTEVGRYVLINQKMDRAVVAMGDLVSQEESLTATELTALYDAVAPIMTPFGLGSNAVMIVSSISLVSGSPKITWQRTGAGTAANGSKIGVQGGAPVLPSGMTVTSGDTLIVTEIYYAFTTLWTPIAYTSILSNQTLYHRAFFRPRVGALDSISTGAGNAPSGGSWFQNCVRYLRSIVSSALQMLGVSHFDGAAG